MTSIVETIQEKNFFDKLSEGKSFTTVYAIKTEYGYYIKHSHQKYIASDRLLCLALSIEKNITIDCLFKDIDMVDAFISYLIQPDIKKYRVGRYPETFEHKTINFETVEIALVPYISIK